MGEREDRRRRRRRRHESHNEQHKDHPQDILRLLSACRDSPCERALLLSNNSLHHLPPSRGGDNLHEHRQLRRVSQLDVDADGDRSTDNLLRTTGEPQPADARAERGRDLRGVHRRCVR